MGDVPQNKKRKPTSKKSFSMNDFKKKLIGIDIPDKNLEWIPLSKAMQKATGLPGIPMGYVSLARGFSNTGKSTALVEAMVASQKMKVNGVDILPIIFDTENNLGKKRLEMMGFDFNKNYLILDNEFLLYNFGKKKDKSRREASIEDLADAIYYFIDEQENGRLPYHILFGIDSLGSLDCIRTINALEKNTSDNNMWNAGAFEKTFKYLLNSKIPSSRKQNKKFVNSILGIQKIWLDSMSGGRPTVKHKGGETFYYGARLIYHYGGIMTHGTSFVKATNKEREVAYGIDTKVSVAKNQIDSELGGISLEGKIMSVPHGFVFKDDLKEYKKEHISFFRNILGNDVNPEDITDKFEEISNDANLSQEFEILQS